MSEQMEQIKSMIDEAARLALAKAGELARSGAIEKSAPHFCKAIVCAALKDVAASYRPFSDEGKADLKNLEHF